MLQFRISTLGGVLAAVVALAGCGYSGTAQVVVPREYRSDIKRAAGTCDGISPQLLAAQIEQESGWDRRAESSAGAQGIAQFMPETWAVWGRDLTGDGRADPFNPREAIDAQGRLMCHLYSLAQESGLDDDPEVLALAAYNAGWGPVSQFGGVPPYPETKEYVRTIRKSRESVRFR